MQLQITLRADGEPCFPLNYNHQLQSAIYSKLSEADASDSRHDVGFGGAKNFKAFVFGALRGRHTVENKTIRFTDEISFEVRSPIFQFCDDLQRSLELYPRIKLFDTALTVCGVSVLNRHINSRSIVAAANTAVVVHKTTADGKTIYYSPEEPEFTDGIERNFTRKFISVCGAAPRETDIIPTGSYKKVVTSYKDTWITGYLGKFELRGDRRELEFIYNTGLGAKNSQGFGMLDVL